MKEKTKINSSNQLDDKTVTMQEKTLHLEENINPLLIGADGLPTKTYSLDEMENRVWNQRSDYQEVDIRKI